MPLDEAVLDHQVVGYTEAPDGAPRMQVVVVAARRSMIEALLEAAKQRRPEARGRSTSTPSRWCAPLCRHGHRRRTTRRASTATSAASPTSPSPSAPPASSPGRSPRSGTTRTPARAWPTRSAFRSTTTWPRPRRSRVGEIVLSGPGSADDQLVESLGLHLGLPTTVAAPLGVLDASALPSARTRTGSRSPPASRWGGRMRPSTSSRPSTARTSRPGGKSGSAYLVLGVLAVFLVASSPTCSSPNKITDREVRTSPSPSRRPPRRAPRQQMGPFANFAQIKEQRVASVRCSPTAASTGSAPCASSRTSCPTASGCRTSTPRCRPLPVSALHGRHRLGPDRRSSFTAARRSSRRSR